MTRMHSCIKRFCLFILATLIFFSTTPATVDAAAVLKLNSRGNEVVTLQKKLVLLQYKISNIDGIFGAETKQAVLLFQRDQRIKITGIVDAKTWRELNKVKLPKEQSPAPLPSVSKPDETKPIVVSNKNISPIITSAKKYIGVPYKFGGTTPKGFDCSGYLQYIFAQHKISLPRAADEQYKIGTAVKQAALRPGDLVFFSTYEKGASHCGLYLGDGKFIHVSTSKGVRIDELKDAYWKPKYLGARRIFK